MFTQRQQCAAFWLLVWRKCSHFGPPTEPNSTASACSHLQPSQAAAAARGYQWLRRLIVMAGGDTHRKAVAHGIQHFSAWVITSGPIPSPGNTAIWYSSTSHGFLVVFVVLSFALQSFSTSAARQILFSTCTMALARTRQYRWPGRRRGSGDRCNCDDIHLTQRIFTVAFGGQAVFTSSTL